MSRRLDQQLTIAEKWFREMGDVFYDARYYEGAEAEERQERWVVECIMNAIREAHGLPLVELQKPQEEE